MLFAALITKNKYVVRFLNTFTFLERYYFFIETTMHFCIQYRNLYISMSTSTNEPMSMMQVLQYTVEHSSMSMQKGKSSTSTMKLDIRGWPI